MKRIINGTSTFPLDVQEALCSDPAVAYAVALPDQVGGFGVAVVLAAGATATDVDLAENLRSRSDDAPPSTIVVVVDRISTTEQGKPHRQHVADLIWPNV